MFYSGDLIKFFGTILISYGVLSITFSIHVNELLKIQMSY